MKLTWISKYPARPGQLIEWRLHPTTIAAAARSARDPRPPSYMQEAHVRTAALLRDVGLQAPTWLGTAFEVPGALQVEALETALSQWLSRHETLRSGLRLVGHELHRFTLSADAVAFDRVVVDHFYQRDDVVRYLEERFDEATDPLTWPPYLFATVAREDGFTVYLAFDHSNVDGYSIGHIPHEIHELYRAVLDRRPALVANAGSYVDFSKIERDVADGFDADHPAVQRWRDFVASCGGGLPGFPLDLGLAPGEIPLQTGVCESLLDPTEADAFDAACAAAGGSFLAGVLAVASVVACERGNHPIYRTILPFHTRTQSRWSASLGWYVGLAPLEIATTDARDFHDLVRLARDAARAARLAARVPFAKVCTLLDTVVRPVSVVSYMDGRRIPGVDRWGEWKAHAFGKVSYGDDAYLWVNRAVDGLYVTCRYPSTGLAHTNIAAFIEHMREVLMAVARNGTCSFAGQLLR
jgi:Condensation domain